MVVKKRDASSFSNIQLAVFFQVYRACVGGETRDKPRKVGIDNLYIFM